MNYLSVSPDEQEYMLRKIGVAAFEDLLGDIAQKVRLDGDLDLEGGMDELAVYQRLRTLAEKNENCLARISFAGGGCYDHYIPAFIDHILRRPEFFTAYTPYQPEISQGTLGAIFEYQSAICQLTGMQVANASMYDGASALAEAALMSVRVHRGKRTKIVALDTLDPQYLAVLETYALADTMQVQIVSREHLTTAVTDTTASVLIGYPDYWGIIDDIAVSIECAHVSGALAVVAANPLMLALLDSPGSLGADIVVGEAQCLGNPQSFGGPGLGFFASTEKLMRSMPGRIVGRTTDAEGKTGYVLTLATREQHIRREKATSNICSNHALNALATGAYLMFMGGDGLRAVAQTCVDKAHYLHAALARSGVFEPCDEGEFGYEFAMRYVGTDTAENLYDRLFAQNYIPGIVVGDDIFLFAVTEKRTTAQIDAFVKAVTHACKR